MTTQYTVTITEAGAADKPQMTVLVEVVDGQAHVVEMTVRAQVGADLAGSSFPAIDLECLARSFVPVAPPAERPRARLEPPAPQQTQQPQPAAQETQPAEAPPAPAERPRRRTRTTPRTSGDTPVPKARVYRKMPDPDELQRVYAEIGTIAGVAKHYDVPAHTAQGWIGRLRARTVAG